MGPGRQRKKYDVNEIETAKMKRKSLAGKELPLCAWPAAQVFLNNPGKKG